VFEHECDLLADNAAESIVSAAVNHFGKVDILVNNAGTNRREPIFEVSRQNWDTIAGINLRLPYELSRAAAKLMAERGSGGSIVHIGSLNNAIGLEGVSVYGAHKAALCQLAKSMAVEWARYGIRVNALCPGFMLTPLSKPLWDDPQKGAWITERSLMRRPGYPEELVGSLLLLTSQAGSFITGQAIYVEGGWLAGTPWSESHVE
jgi:NAD(P)-dependent dehydrogenase (short-subunit alcohol dehydrogenase family)